MFEPRPFLDNFSSGSQPVVPPSAPSLPVTTSSAATPSADPYQFLVGQNSPWAQAATVAGGITGIPNETVLTSMATLQTTAPAGAETLAQIAGRMQTDNQFMTQVKAQPGYDPNNAIQNTMLAAAYWTKQNLPALGYQTNTNGQFQLNAQQATEAAQKLALVRTANLQLNTDKGKEDFTKLWANRTLTSSGLQQKGITAPAPLRQQLGNNATIESLTAPAARAAQAIQAAQEEENQRAAYEAEKKSRAAATSSRMLALGMLSPAGTSDGRSVSNDDGESGGDGIPRNDDDGIPQSGEISGARPRVNRSGFHRGGGRFGAMAPSAGTSNIPPDSSLGIDDVIKKFTGNDPRAFANTKALLDTIGFTEGTINKGAGGYNVRLGGGLFDISAGHPGEHAAGKFQFMYPTWTGLWGGRNEPMTPLNQVYGALKLFQEKGALGDIMNGNFEPAISKISGTWPSVPGGSQQTKTMGETRAFYESRVGLYEQGGRPQVTEASYTTNFASAPGSKFALATGDSIAVGFLDPKGGGIPGVAVASWDKNDGMSADGAGSRNPQQVYEYMESKGGAYFRRGPLLLSTGASNKMILGNDPANLRQVHALVKRQLDFLQQEHVNVVVAGVNERRYPGYNAVIKSAAEAHGMPFAGDLPGTEVHLTQQGYKDYVTRAERLIPTRSGPAAIASTSPSSAMHASESTPGQEQNRSPAERRRTPYRVALADTNSPLPTSNSHTKEVLNQKIKPLHKEHEPSIVRLPVMSG